MDILTWLEGRKTFFACSVGLALIGCVGMGWIEVPKEQIDIIVKGITLVAIAALRAAV